MLLPKGDFLMVKRGIIMLCPIGNGIVLRGIGLHDDPPWTGTTSSPSRHLAKKLKGALTSTKVREVKDSVSGDYAHQGYLRKVQPLGNHLRPDKDVCLVSQESIQDLLVRILSLGNISIPPEQSRLGEDTSYLLLHPLCADAQKLNSPAPACGTTGRD